MVGGAEKRSKQVDRVSGVLCGSWGVFEEWAVEKLNVSIGSLDIEDGKVTVL